MEELKKYLEELKTEASAELDEAPEDLFYIGFISAIKSINDYINTGRKREII